MGELGLSVSVSVMVLVAVAVTVPVMVMVLVMVMVMAGDNIALELGLLKYQRMGRPNNTVRFTVNHG